MRFSYAESMVDPSYYLPLARAAEEAGYDSFVVPDSICYPEVSDTTYPFNPDGSREFLDDKPFLEPFALRALGQARLDEHLIERALERFRALGLDWYADQTQRLLGRQQS